jgi:hypothetical protein
MKKFTDKTNSLKEPSIKTGNFVPKDAVNLGWFSGREISPKNNLSVVDLTSLIPENINTEETLSQLMYANELGILEDQKGNTYIEPDDISVSDVFLNNMTLDEKYSIEELKTYSFIHSYYVSRYFTLVPTKVLDDFSINDYLDDRFIPNHIKVLDENGKLYADPVTGVKKYRIILEAFLTEENINHTDIPHKIFVLFDEPKVSNFTLVYDKIEVKSTGLWNKQQLKFSEKINTVPFFDHIKEETQVVDPGNSNKNSFSLKRNSKKYLVDGLNIGDAKNQIYVNKKAIDDNRVFEVFNWRLIAKIQNHVDFSLTNYGNPTSSNSTIATTVNVGVLYSSKELNLSVNELPSQNSLSSIKPYVALNLQNSPFNLANYSFINPVADAAVALSKDMASYWLVDIDNLSDLNQFDVLFISLFWKLNDTQAKKLNNFVSNNGTLIVDASGAPADGLNELNPIFTMSSDYVSGSSYSYNTGSIYINKDKNNAFSIDNDQFEANCGIFGYLKTVNNTNKSYRYFSNSATKSVLYYTDESKKIVVSARSIRKTDNLVAGNIIVSSAPMFDYVNNIYDSSALVPRQNNSQFAISSSNNSTFSKYVERTL